ncbi:MAG: AMP-binding protein [Chloroflexi bacterium]|nr:AMP-binding protein [Chloroflexota bacterium]
MAIPARYTPQMMEEYLKTGQWNPVPWPEVWDNNARDFPNHEAICDARTRLTWGQAKEWIDRFALGFLEMGFKRDEVMVIQLPNSAELALLRLACEKAGILCAPVLRTLRHKEMEYILSFTGARGIIIPLEFRGFNYLQMVQEIRPVLPGLKDVFVAGDVAPAGCVSIKEMLQKPLEKKYPPGYLKKFTYDARETSWISHTSGSTGFPKFVQIPAVARRSLCEGQVHVLKLTQKDVVGALSPATGGPNIITYWAAAMVGARVVMMEHFEAEEAMQLIQKEKISVAGLVPTMLTGILRHPNRHKYDLSSMRAWYCAAGTPPFQLVKELEETVGGKVIQAYGAVDYGCATNAGLDDSMEVRVLTAGKPCWGARLKIVDDNGNELPRGEVGEVWGTGPGGVGGYYKDEKATWEAWTRDNWYRTGDLGKINEDGNLLIVGRKKEMIKRGGQNIYPIEVEKLLITHPRVNDVAVVGMPDPEMLERACAYVVPKPGQKFLFDDMSEFLKEKGLAPFKIPERLEILEKMPMLAADQKIDKKVLKADIVEKLKAEGKV